MPKPLTISTKFEFGDIVFLRVRVERFPGMITGIIVRPVGGFLYQVAWGDKTETNHFEVELTREFVPDYGTTT